MQLQEKKPRKIGGEECEQKVLNFKIKKNDANSEKSKFRRKRRKKFFIKT